MLYRPMDWVRVLFRDMSAVRVLAETQKVAEKTPRSPLMTVNCWMVVVYINRVIVKPAPRVNTVYSRTLSYLSRSSPQAMVITV